MSMCLAHVIPIHSISEPEEAIKGGCLERDILQLAGSDSLIMQYYYYSTVVSNDYYQTD